MRIIYRRKNYLKSGAMIEIPIEGLEDVESVKREFTFQNPAFWKARQAGKPTEGIPDKLFAWRIAGSSIFVPRNSRFAELIPGAGVPPVCRTVAKNLEHKIKLRDEVQEEASRALSSTRKDKILSLSCGKGKTICALHAASVAKMFPLLVVVPTSALLTNWRSEIAEKYGIDPSEIGHVQAGVEDWKGRSVIIATLQSLCLKVYSDEFYQYFKLLVIDEAHRIGSMYMSRVCSLFTAERWGLSATVAREDRMEELFQLHIGKVAYENTSQPLVPDVVFVETGVRVKLDKFTWRGNVNTGRLYTWVSRHYGRTLRTVWWMKRSAEQGRNIIALGERTGHLQELRGLLRESGVDAEVHIGASTEEERAIALTKPVVLATQHLAREGLNKPSLDTLFIFIPFGGRGRLKQSLGRILREHPGKKPPLVFIFVDDCDYFEALARKMKVSLRSLGFPYRVMSAGYGPKGEALSEWFSWKKGVGRDSYLQEE